MAIVKPFKGVRPPQDLVEQVASRPYDVLNSAEAREEAKGNEKSLYHIIKPEIDFPEGTDEHDPRVYDKAVANFRMFQEKGWLVQDDKPCYYIYAQTMNGKTQYGLVVGAYVPDYMNGVIKKHELTRRDKEEDRMKHVRVNNANIEPVFFAYPENKTLDAVVAKYTAQKPVYDFVAPDDGFGHQFWVIDDDKDIEAVTEAFKEMPSLYIADGHHRSAAAALVGINRMFQLGLTKRQLMERGVQIGADVPYCVMRGTALAEGIGEKLTSLPGVPMCYVLIGKPGINVSTKFVYGNLHLDEVTDHPDIDGMVQAIRNHDLYGITDRMGNVLESVTCPAYPVIDEIKAQMMKNGAVNAMMSGSGPTVFGIFDDPDKAEFARDQLKISGLSKQTFLTTVSKPGGTKYGKK